jgi:SAM-dependent methyltransferase
MSDRDALAARLSSAMLGAMELLSVHLGDRLGFYRALAAHGPMTSAELASRAGTDERYTREWLEQQAVAGILSAVKGEIQSTRRFSLSPGHAEVLTDPDNLATMIPAARFLAGIAGVLPELEDAYRTGAGVPYARYGRNAREGQAGMTRPLFVNLLGSEWFPATPEIDARLRDAAMVADIGCGAGWSSIAIARAYPKACVDGLDLDDASVDLARRNAEQAGVADRVSFEVRDAGDPALAGRYDLVCAFECVHDMANPVAALRAMRQLMGPDGVVLIADEKVADRFTAPGDESERSNYGYSILHCLPVGRADQPSVATGAVMRQDILRGYASDAGFQSVEVLPIAHDWWRFYRLLA